MAQILRVEEWQSPTKRWYVADTHTWTNWRALAAIFDLDYEGLLKKLVNVYGASIDRFIEYDNQDSLLIFSFLEYKGAHQFKLDVNRIARKKNFLVEKQF